MTRCLEYKAKAIENKKRLGHQDLQVLSQMKRRRTTTKYVCIAIGVALVFVVSSLTTFAESYPANFVLLGLGVVLLFLSIGVGSTQSLAGRAD